MNGLFLFCTVSTDQEGSTYFVELEEALMQGVVGIRAESVHVDRSPFLISRPPTLEIFPSWPMRFQQPAKGNSQREESTASGSSAQNTSSYQDSDSPLSRKDSIDHLLIERKQQEKLASKQVGAQEKKNIGGPSLVKGGKIPDAKILRLAQNREAARKSRLRKKAYIQQLESGRIKLTRLEQELRRARSQGLFVGGGSILSGNLSSGAAIFDMEYGRWLDENYKLMAELRGALQAHLPDDVLRLMVDGCLANYDKVFRLKAAAAKADVFHLLAGVWKTPTERCFLWMGGFRPSELIKLTDADTGAESHEGARADAGMQTAAVVSAGGGGAVAGARTAAPLTGRDHGGRAAQ